MSMKKLFLSPNGLNDLLSEILGETISGEFDAAIPNYHYAGKFLREEVPKILPGKIGSEWGAMMEGSA